MICKLTRNITLSSTSSSSGGSCEATDISVGVGGLRSPAYLYNFEDVQNLKFENDNRADDTYVVDTIITDEPFYSIEFSDATYSETYENGKWTHTLELTINNITTLFEELLAESTNGKYLVCFKPNGDDDYRMFGWRWGASLTYQMNLSSDSLGYTVTLTDESEYPLMSVYNNNFSLADKTFTPIFKVLFDVVYCEQTSGQNNGYAVAEYVVKVNSAGQALDEDNKLCYYSGKKQDAYKLQGVSDADYHIIGTYTSTAEFEGQPVRVYDSDLCPSQATGTITISGASAATITLDSTVRTMNVTLHSDNNWAMLSSPQYVTVSPQNGNSGNTSILVFHNGVGGQDNIVFQNKITKERVTLTVNVYIIDINSSYTYQNGTTQFILSPRVMGGSRNYTYSISPSLTASKDSDGNLVCSPTVSNDEQNFVITFTHVNDAQEVKSTNVKILGNNVSPSWQVLSTWCETSNS